MIVHLDADAFFASVEQAADRRLRGRPIAVGGERRGVVASASYEARQWGIGAAMPTARARKLCPQLIVVPGDFEKYELFSRLIFAYAHDFTPLVEQTSIDEGYFDLGPNRRADPHGVAETIKRAVRQTLKVGVSEGVASNKLVAQVASKLRKPDALVEVAPGREREFLAPLPNRWLPGVGPKLAASLDAAGLREIGQIAEVSAEQLMLFAGEQAPQLRRFALGEDDRLVVTERAEAKSYSKQTTFGEDVTDEAYVGATLRVMADGLFGRVRSEGKAVRTISIKIRYNDMQDTIRSESLAEPTELETDVYGLLARLLKAAWTRRVSLRGVTVRLSNIYDGMPLELALDAEAGKREARSKAAAVVDALRARGTPLMRGHDLWLRATEGAPREDLARAAGNARRATAASEAVAREVAPAVLTVRRGKACAADFVPLNLRSSYSFLDSLLTPAAAAAEAARHGTGFAALCDPNLHGAVEFTQACASSGVRAVTGAELRVEGRRLLCFAEDDAGYANLCRLLSEPRVGRALWEESRAGLSVLEAGDLVGAGDVGALPEIRYVRGEDKLRHDILRSIRTLTRLNEPHPGKPAGAFHWPSRERIEAMEPGEVRRTREVAERCQGGPRLGKLHFPSYNSATGEEARALLRRLVMEGFRSGYGPESGRRGVAGAGSGGGIGAAVRAARAAQVRSQLEEELAIIAEVGYEEYFLTVWDLLQECRALGIPWITRGSAGDSLVCRCLGISDFCPVRFELYFRRFLNRERMALNKLPDIDLDFPHDRKDDVVDLIFRRFGRTHTAVVGGFNTFRARSAVAEILKVLGVAEFQVRRFTENFPWGRTSDLAALLTESRECTDLPLTEEPYRSALSLAAFLDGFPRHAKMHPCGVVISRVPILSVTPTFMSDKGYPTTHFDMDACEAAGLVKMDILAQGGLAVLRDVKAGLGGGGAVSGQTTASLSLVAEPLEAWPVRDDDTPPGDPWDDPRIWDLIASGDARGVHHIESPAMISLSRMCGVRMIDQLVAVVSVIRPGAANNLKKQTFARRCQGLERTEYAHPSLEPVLRSTYGVVAYEEHILQICEAFAGLPAGRADVLRRALVKEKKDTVRTIRVEFEACARARGRTENEILAVWGLVEGFMGYAFCRAHSTAYALEAYEAAWFKSRHPAEFLAGVLTHGKGFYSRLVYTLEARRLGVGLAAPDINNPREDFFVVRRGGGGGGTGGGGRNPAAQAIAAVEPGTCIQIPITAISGLSAKLLAAWRRGLPFVSLDDFIGRVPAEFAEIQALIRTGAFDGFGRKRAAQYWEASALVMEAGLGPSLGMELVSLPPAERLADTSRAERLEAEWEMLGFTVDDHPLARWPRIDWSGYRPVAELGAVLGTEVDVCGLVVNERLHDQADDRLMKFVLIADRSGMLECELFADVYERWGAVVARNPVVALRGVPEPFENGRGWTLRVLSASAPRLLDDEAVKGDA